METRANYILIGATMLFVAVAVVFFSLWLGGGKGDFSDEYDVYFSERVSGLSEGSDVRFNGIKVGEIKELRLARNNPEEVIARIAVIKDTPIKEDTKAELEMVGVTGLAIIQFTGGTPDSRLIKDVRRARIPRIDASPSVVSDILAGGTDVIAGAQRVLDEDNTERLSRILEDIEVITAAVADNGDDIDTILSNAATISEDLVAFAASLEKTSKNLEVVIMSMEQVFENDVPKSIAEFDIAVADAQLLMGQLNTLLENNEEALDAFMQQGLGESAGVLADTRRLIRTMDSILLEVERDPAQFFFGETRPKRKARK